ncbi:E3 ubiquitin-protein ligase Os03g0188200-like [Triticum urartu]|uniref:RING-type domain-containing protein n=1 Tax=Triticum urartu TaxID=4572 RepID=A0A8R7K3K6_TRIUA|nr:E3 ubiquitin-protein ligase Os03g0188200-like [Triticum urartu]
MSSASVPPPVAPERRVPVVVPVVPHLAEEGGGGSGSGGMAGISPSILIIAVIVVVMLLASISIHYFIRSLCRRSPSSASGSSAPPLPLVAVRSSAVAPAAAAAAPVADQGKEAAAERERLIGRLPLFTLASSLAALPRSSRDCAVCQCVFCADDELRLLPACRHAFHSGCVDPWLRANPSCPLCRASIALPYPPLPELLRVELGSVSSRRSTSSSSSAAVAAAPPEGVRAYPLPNSNTNTEYLVEEDLQVVLKPPSAANPAPPPPPTARITGEPSQQLAAAAERGLSSSVTPTASFRSVGRSSSRWSNRWSNRWSSGRWSSRYDAGSVTAAATAEWWWDMDGGVAPASRRAESEDGSAFYGFVRWLTGAY